jgi:hypothetical protein
VVDLRQLLRLRPLRRQRKNPGTTQANSRRPSETEAAFLRDECAPGKAPATSSAPRNGRRNPRRPCRIPKLCFRRLLQRSADASRDAKLRLLCGIVGRCVKSWISISKVRGTLDAPRNETRRRRARSRRLNRSCPEHLQRRKVLRSFGRS